MAIEWSSQATVAPSFVGRVSSPLLTCCHRASLVSISQQQWQVKMTPTLKSTQKDQALPFVGLSSLTILQSISFIIHI